MKVEYFYDGQFRRTLMHLIWLFSEFQVQFGTDDEGNPKYRKVPCRYADFSRMAQYIISGGSENVAKSAPMMTVSVDEFTMARKDVRSHWSQKIVLGTNVSPAQNEYTPELDKQYFIERFNPVPWDLTFSVNIWTTLLTSKMEIMEQIATLFAPAVTLQTSENPLDWCSLTDVELIGTTFSSRAMPQGTDTDLDIATMQFKCQVWMSLPAKVTKPKSIKFLQGIEDTSPIKGEVISVGTDDNANKLLVQVDSSIYQNITGIKEFIVDADPLTNALPEQLYINISERNIDYKKSTIPPNYLAKITNDGAEIIEPSTISGYVYNSSDECYYRYNSEFGWHRGVMNKYRAGYWRIGFKD